MGCFVYASSTEHHDLLLADMKINSQIKEIVRRQEHSSDGPPPGDGDMVILDFFGGDMVLFYTFHYKGGVNIS